MNKAGRVLPEIKMKAEEFINVGYQKLLTFQRPEGGFDWWGSGPPLVFLTAYGVQEFNDMGKVYPIDSHVIERAREWLLKQQGKDGSWSKVGATHGVRMQRFKKPALPLTAYVAWSILETGEKGKQVAKAISYIKRHLDDADGNSYIMALAANALIAYDPKDRDGLLVLRALDGQKEVEGETAYWQSEGQTMYYSSGKSGDIETTALVAYAMIRSGTYPDTVNKALAYLVKARGGGGTWGSTQATILAMKALIEGLGGAKQTEPAEISFELNGQRKSVTVTPENADVMQLLDLKDLCRKGTNDISISVAGKTNMMYQLVGRYYLPWEDVIEPKKVKPIEISLSYDRKTLSRNDTLKAKVSVRYNGLKPTFMVIVDLGIPPGFKVDPADFAELLGEKMIERYSITGRQITVYIGQFNPGQEIEFSYSLKAKYPIKAKTPPSVAYEYYTPENRDVAEPVEITVK